MNTTKKILKKKLDLIPLFQKLDESKNDDLKLVIISNTILELLVNILIEEKTKNKDRIINGNEYSYSIKLVVLNEKNIIRNDLFNAIDNLRKIRNKAAHIPNFELNDNDVKNLSIRKNEKFYDGCNSIIGALWNQNKDLFMKHFNL